MKQALLPVCLAVLLTGCAAVAREPSNLTLIRILGVDGGESVTLTAVSGKTQNGVSRGSAQGDGFHQARQQVPWSGAGTELSVTGVSYLVFGSDADLQETLAAVMADSDLGASATVWCVQGSAAELLDRCEDPAADLSCLEQKGVQAPTAAQTLFFLTTDGAVTLPCLTEENGRIKDRGTMLWSEGE